MVGYIRGAKFFDSAKLGKQYQNDISYGITTVANCMILN